MTEPIRQAAAYPPRGAHTGARPHDESRPSGLPAFLPERSAAQAFTSLLSKDGRGLPTPPDLPDLAMLSDHNLDQIVAAVAGDREERELITSLLCQQVRGIGIIRYRQEVFRDVEDPGLFRAAVQFAGQMHEVRVHLDQLPKMQSGRQREGWFPDAAAIYCDAVRSLARALDAQAITSRGLTALRDYLAGYIASTSFARLAADTADRKRDLAGINYQVRIKGPAGGGEPA